MQLVYLYVTVLYCFCPVRLHQGGLGCLGQVRPRQKHYASQVWTHDFQIMTVHFVLLKRPFEPLGHQWLPGWPDWNISSDVSNGATKQYTAIANAIGVVVSSLMSYPGDTGSVPRTGIQAVQIHWKWRSRVPDATQPHKSHTGLWRTTA